MIGYVAIGFLVSAVVSGILMIVDDDDLDVGNLALALFAGVAWPAVLIAALLLAAALVGGLAFKWALGWALGRTQ